MVNSPWIGTGQNVLAPPFQEIHVVPFQGLQRDLIVQETLLLQLLMAVLRTVFAKKQVLDGVKIDRLGLMVQMPSNHLVCPVRYLTNALLHLHLRKKLLPQSRQVFLIYLNGRPLYSTNDRGT